MTVQSRGAIVTGGGRGIGAATAEALSNRGSRVVVAARTSTEIDSVASTLRENGGEAWAICCDVTDPESIESLIAQSIEQLGQIDILVNNAGIATAAPLVKTSLSAWTQMWAVNTTGSFLCMKATLPHMVERGWGRVVNVASIAGLRGAAYISGYAASKHAQIGLTRSAAAEVASAGVTVNAVCPGYVDTPMTDTTIANITDKTGMSEEEAFNAILATSPQHRLITSEEVAASIAFLCTDEARAINGQTIVLDGGAISTH
jgi:3-hydroxybutyrate dehydrogenase